MNSGIGLQPVKIHILFAIVGAKPHHVPLVGHDVGQLVLLEESLEGRVLFTLFLAGLDGEADVILVIEAETEHGVGNK